MHNYLVGYGMGLPMWAPAAGIALAVLIVWGLFWKGAALWRSAGRGDRVWFIVFLIVNTAGILEIIYLFFISGGKMSDLSLPLKKDADQ